MYMNVPDPTLKIKEFGPTQIAEAYLISNRAMYLNC